MEVIFEYSSPEERINVIKTSNAKIDEDSLFFMSDTDKERFLQITNAEKKIEFFAGRLCVSLVTAGSLHYECIQNQPPYAEEGFLSISHTRGYAAAVYHTHKKVGIDIELSDRLVKDHILKRFASDDELTQIQSPHDALRLWCAKEAVFKAGHIHGLEFRDHIHINWLNHDIGYGFIKFGFFNKNYTIRRYSVNDIITVYAVEQ